MMRPQLFCLLSLLLLLVVPQLAGAQGVPSPPASNARSYLDVLNISAQKEVFAYEYINKDEGNLEHKPVSLPIILPLLGLKGTY